MRCIRRSSISAVKSTHATLASSDGWMPSPPRPNQRRDPLTGGLNSTATSSRPTKASSPDDHDVAAIGAVVDAHHDGQHRQAQHRPQRLLDQEQIGLVEPLQRHQRRGAEHHHDAHADQEKGRREEHPIRLEFPCHAPPPIVRTPPHSTDNDTPGRDRLRIPIPRGRRGAVSGHQSARGVGHRPRRLGLVCVPSGQRLLAPSRLTTAHGSSADPSTSLRRRRGSHLPTAAPPPA